MEHALDFPQEITYLASAIALGNGPGAEGFKLDTGRVPKSIAAGPIALQSDLQGAGRQARMREIVCKWSRGGRGMKRPVSQAV